MRDNEILGQAAAFFKRNYPGLSPEAIVAFFVAADKSGATIGEIAGAVGVPETKLFEHLGTMREGSGAGLVSIQPLDGGRNAVVLTDRGEQAKADFLATLAG